MYIRSLAMLAVASTSSVQQFHKLTSAYGFGHLNSARDLKRFFHQRQRVHFPYWKRSFAYFSDLTSDKDFDSNGVPRASVSEESQKELPVHDESVEGTTKVDGEKGKSCGLFGAPFMETKCEHTLSNSALDIEMHKKIFCNRSLNMKSILAVGFDMDYTLAQYRPETFETLAYHGTVKKLVFDLGYPRELLDWKFDWRYMVRGLVLDKKRGNILKMDRHKYVKVAYHGFQEIARDERLATYCNTLTRESFDEPDFALIDTLFSLAEAYLFAQLVEFKDKCPSKFPSITDYSVLYRDVRAAVDLCHRDGTLKQAVAQNPSKYIHFDKELIPMLKMLRNSGRMTFLVTNSLWDYTNVVMNYLFGKSGADRDVEWLQLFDIVLTGSAKPGFFADGSRALLYEVDIKTGMLQNTDNGSPLAQIGASPTECLSSLNNAKPACRVFQGGNVIHLHNLLGIEAGSQVLYVGDHIYGDILRSKKELGWRTMLVVPELDKELQMFYQTVYIRKKFRFLRHRREFLDDKIQRLDWSVRHGSHNDEDRQKLMLEIEMLQIERDRIRESHRNAQKICHEKFHKVWGQLMKTGYQNSRFAHQVERFACLYTSQVTNLCYYSPDKSFRTHEDFMPHEFEHMDF